MLIEAEEKSQDSIWIKPGPGDYNYRSPVHQALSHYPRPKFLSPFLLMCCH